MKYLYYVIYFNFLWLLKYAESKGLASEVPASIVEWNPCKQALGLGNNVMTDDQILIPTSADDKLNLRLNGNGNYFNTREIKFDFKKIMKITGFFVKLPSGQSSNVEFKFGFQPFENDDNKFQDVRQKDDNNARKYSLPKNSAREKRYDIGDDPIITRFLKMKLDQEMEFKFELYGCSELCSNMVTPHNASLLSKEYRSKKLLRNLPTLRSNDYVCLNLDKTLSYMFQNRVKLSGISVQNKNITKVEVKFEIHCSNDGKNFSPLDNGTVFGGNINKGDSLTTWIINNEYCMYVNIIYKSVQSTCLQVQPLGCNSGCVDKLGIEANKGGITYTSSSYWDRQAMHHPKNGRLNEPNLDWAPDRTDKNDTRFWQACLDDVVLISGVLVQGQGIYSNTIQGFRVMYSYKVVQTGSETGLHEYTSNGTKIMFPGTKNRYETNHVVFPTAIFAKCLRLYVYCVKSDACAARFEFAGCRNVPLVSPKIVWLKSKKVLSCKIENAQPESLDWFVFDTKISSDDNYDVASGIKDLVKVGYKEVNVTIKKDFSSVFKLNRNCSDDAKRKAFTCTAIYTCKANFDGSGKYISTSRHEVLTTDYVEIPALPDNVNTLQVNATEVEIQWDFVRNENIFPILFVHVRVVITDGKLIGTYKTEDGSNVKIILDKLSPFTNYTGHLKSSNKYHNSSEVSFSFQTDQSASSPPTNLKVLGKKLLWDKPRVANGIISNYMILCERSNGSERIVKESDKTEATIYELAQKLEYKCKVRAFTKDGQIPGKWSSSVSMINPQEEPCFFALGMENGVISDKQISAKDSNQNSKASYGRLNHPKGWCSDSADSYLEVDFGILVTINGLALQGSLNKKWSIKLQYAIESKFNFVYKPLPDQQEMVFYHSGGNITRRHSFEDSALTVRKIQILLEEKNCLKVEFYGCAEVCSRKLKSSNIDNAATKSLSISSTNVEETQVCFQPGSSSQKLSFSKVQLLSGILIENYAGVNMRTQQSFDVEYQAENNGWKGLQTKFGEKVMSVSTLLSYKMYWYNVLEFDTLKINSNITGCFNLTFFGCSSKCMNKLGIEKNITGLNFTASSNYSYANHARNGLLNNIQGDWTEGQKATIKKHYFPGSAWIQVCLPKSMFITAIALQGQGYWNDGYVKKFQLQYSFDGKQLFNYTDDSSNLKEFVGTDQRYKTKVIMLPEPITSKCLRLHTVACNKPMNCSLRWEFLGCMKGGVPKISGTSSSIFMKKGFDGYVSSTIEAQPGVQIEWKFRGKSLTDGSLHKISWNNKNMTLKAKFVSNVTIDKTISSVVINEDVPCDDDTSTFVKCRLVYTCEAYYPSSEGGKVEKNINVEVKGFNAFMATPNILNMSISNTSVTVRWESMNKSSNAGDFPSKGYKITLYKKDKVLNETQLSLEDITFMELSPFIEYEVSIASFNRLNKFSTPAKKSFQTKEGVPSKITDLTFTSKTKDSISLKWSEPSPSNGVVSKYLIEYEEKDASDGKKELEVDGSLLFKKIESLKNFQDYTFRVQAFTDNGTLAGPWSEWKHGKTAEGPPSEPQNVEIISSTRNSVNLSWSEPAFLNGILKNYQVSYTGIKSYNESFAHNNDVDVNKETSVLIEKLYPSTYYKFTVVAITGGGLGKKSQFVNQSLPIDNPFPPHIEVIEEEMESMTFKLFQTPDWNGKIRYYEAVIRNNGKKCFNGNQDTDGAFSFKSRQENITVYKGLKEVKLLNGKDIELELVGKYVFCYRAVSVENKMPYVSNTTKKLFERKDLAKVSNESVTSDYKRIIINLSKGPPNTKYYQVIVAEGEITDLSLNTNTLKPYDKSSDGPYITAEFTAEKFDDYKPFTVGDNKIFKKVGLVRFRRDVDSEVVYKNQELKPGTIYSIVQLGFDDKGNNFSTPCICGIKTLGTAPRVQTEKGDQTVLIVAVTVSLLLVLASIAFGVVLYRRRRQPAGYSETSRKLKNDDTLQKEKPVTTSFQEIGDDNAAMETDEIEDPLDKKPPATVQKDSKHPPIKLSEFLKHYEKLKKDSGYLLSTEFKALNGGQQYKWSDSTRPEVKTKNRYANIVTYDHSRVKLKKISDNDNDYINASYIHGYSKENMYIASQGPNDASVNDFWRMIWEKEIPCIVMLTNLIEKSKRKCCLYWPERHSQKFGDIEVSTIESLSFSDCVIRKFCIRLVNGKEKHEVHQYHYLSWPDHGVPKFPSDIVNLRYKVRKVFPMAQTDRPILVHCSAGVGRTGTFLSIDTMLDLAREKKIVDIFNYVNFMRTRRIHMVQTEEQYSFVYQALAEAFMCGVTEINAPDISIVTNRLLQPNQQGTKMNGYELQFNKLSKIIPRLREEDTKFALQEENMKKNRYPNIYPRDDNRVVVFQSVYDGDESDYINASFVDGYKEPQAFISTQHPLDTTISTFWQMICQFNITTIVSLNDLYEGEEVFSSFWPNSGDTLNFKNVKVKCEREENNSDEYSSCQIKVTNEKDSKSFTCSLIRYKKWHGAQEIPNSAYSFMQFLNTVDKAKYKSKERSPMVVVCNDGVSRSGTFIASSIALEYMKLEQSVDVFQAVRKIRSFRPDFIANANQYKFIYDVIISYIDSFNTYSNYTH